MLWFSWILGALHPSRNPRARTRRDWVRRSRDAALLLAAALVMIACSCVPPMPVPPDAPVADAGALPETAPPVVDVAAPEVMPETMPAPVQDAAPIVDAQVPDAGPKPPPMTACEKWCVNAASLGCPEMGTGCVPLCVHMQADPITPVKWDCLANAHSVAAVHVCMPKWCVIAAAVPAPKSSAKIPAK